MKVKRIVKSAPWEIIKHPYRHQLLQCTHCGQITYLSDALEKKIETLTNMSVVKVLQYIDKHSDCCMNPYNVWWTERIGEFVEDHKEGGEGL